MKKVLIVGLFVTALTIGAAIPGQSAINQQKSPTPTTQQKKAMPAKKAEKVVYTCPMHKDVAMDKPGKCPKCGMKLVKKDMSKKVMPKKGMSKTDMPMKNMSKMSYTCPMHQAVAMDQPGKCPKCGMKLVKKEAKKITG